MLSGPIISWQTEGEKSGNGDRFYFLRLKNHWGVTTTMTFKDVCFLKESYDKPRQRIQKQRHTFSTKVYLVKTMVFLLVMYGYESWFVKKAEHQRIDAFELWCWRRLLRVPWTARRSNQSILKKTNYEYSLEGLMLMLQYFGHLMQRAKSLE